MKLLEAQQCSMQADNMVDPNSGEYQNGGSTGSNEPGGSWANAVDAPRNSTGSAAAGSAITNILRNSLNVTSPSGTVGVAGQPRISTGSTSTWGQFQQTIQSTLTRSNNSGHTGLNNNSGQNGYLGEGSAATGATNFNPPPIATTAPKFGNTTTTGSGTNMTVGSGFTNPENSSAWTSSGASAEAGAVQNSGPSRMQQQFAAVGSMFQKNSGPVQVKQIGSQQGSVQQQSADQQCQQFYNNMNNGSIGSNANNFQNQQQGNNSAGSGFSNQAGGNFSNCGISSQGGGQQMPSVFGPNQQQQQPPQYGQGSNQNQWQSPQYGQGFGGSNSNANSNFNGGFNNQQVGVNPGGFAQGFNQGNNSQGGFGGGFGQSNPSAGFQASTHQFPQQDAGWNNGVFDPNSIFDPNSNQSEEYPQVPPVQSIVVNSKKNRNLQEHLQTTGEYCKGASKMFFLYPMAAISFFCAFWVITHFNFYPGYKF